MRPGLNALLSRLQVGHYLVNVDLSGRAHALPISSREAAEYPTICGELAASGRHAAGGAGLYLVHIDGAGHVLDKYGLNKAEASAFISRVLGGCRCVTDGIRNARASL